MHGWFIIRVQRQWMRLNGNICGFCCLSRVFFLFSFSDLNFIQCTVHRLISMRSLKILISAEIIRKCMTTNNQKFLTNQFAYVFRFMATFYSDFDRNSCSTHTNKKECKLIALNCQCRYSAFAPLQQIFIFSNLCFSSKMSISIFFHRYNIDRTFHLG